MKTTSCLLLLMYALIAPGQAKLDTLIPLPPLHTITPSSDRNYIIHYRPHLPVTSISRRLGLSEAEATINYFDGLGRCIQTVETGATPARLDLIKPVIPDFCNRQDVKEYIPYQGTTDKGVYTQNAQVAQNNYYAGIFGPAGGDACAYAERRYEQSGAARLTESSRPGNAFRLSAGHTLRYTYALNTANEVRIYTYDNGTLNSTGYYPAGYLYKQETTDEDNGRRMTFTDHRGNTVLERRCISSGNTLDTYYIYDSFGRPLCIIPPALGGKASVSAAELAAYCYRYAYDKRGNVTERSLPGIAPEKITYNDAGMPVARDQDNRHFTTNYDSHNRLLNEYYRYANGNSITVLQRTYDTYPSVTGLAFAAITGYDLSYDTRTTGLLTYEKERILDGSTETETGITPRYIERCFYYDKKGRIIQQTEKNHLGGISRYSYAYDFVGNITAQREEHDVAGLKTTLEKRNTYDHASRLLSAKIYLNGAYRGKVGYGYDAPGQLTKRSYSEDILTEQISYDIQGRTTSQGSTLFRIGLRYENPLKATPRYAGDIAEWTCSYHTMPEQTYTFNYDGAGRFTGGNHYENGALVNKYAEQGIAYDKNGNILSLKRFNNGALVDNLTYTYSGNRLSSLTEAATPATGDIHPRQNAATATYDYDVYGNLTKDNRKNLNFEYNILNLIHSVKQGTGLQAEYEYAYTGSKLRVTASDGKGYAYLGSLVYMCTGSSYIFEYGIFGEGTVDGSGIRYHLKDHLGSIRAVIDGNGKLLEANDYYAFGQRQPRSELPQLAANRFKYNGKELQTVGNLAFLDYGARMYDAPLGRWFNVDPLCEKYYSLSPYVYCGNSPIGNIDLRGDSITTVVTATENGITRNTTYYYGKDVNGNYGFMNNQGQLYTGDDQFVTKLTIALENLRSGTNGQKLVNNLMNSTNIVKIGRARSTQKNSADPNGKYIIWDPNSTTGGPDQTGNRTRPPYIGLGHEAAHIQDAWNGTIDRSPWITINTENGVIRIPHCEKYATHIENQLRAEHGLPLRSHYSPGINSTSILYPGTRFSRFYTKTVSITGTRIFAIPHKY